MSGDTATRPVAARMHLVMVRLGALAKRPLVQLGRALRAAWQAIEPPPLDGAAESTVRVKLDVKPDGALTPQEAECLSALCERCQGRPEYLEFEMNARRLQFMRWLIQHGQLAEFPECADSEARAAGPESTYEVVRRGGPLT